MAITAGTILVDLQELQEKAELAHRRISDCDAALERIGRTLASTDSFWRGAAATSARDKCDAAVSSSRKALDDFKEYPKELLAYQGLYSEVIAQTEAKAAGISEYELS